MVEVLRSGQIWHILEIELIRFGDVECERDVTVARLDGVLDVMCEERVKAKNPFGFLD